MICQGEIVSGPLSEKLKLLRSFITVQFYNCSILLSFIVVNLITYPARVCCLFKASSTPKPIHYYELLTSISFSVFLLIFIGRS